MSAGAGALSRPTTSTMSFLDSADRGVASRYSHALPWQLRQLGRRPSHFCHVRAAGPGAVGPGAPVSADGAAGRISAYRRAIFPAVDGCAREATAGSARPVFTHARSGFPQCNGTLRDVSHPRYKGFRPRCCATAAASCTRSRGLGRIATGDPLSTQLTCRTTASVESEPAYSYMPKSQAQCLARRSNAGEPETRAGAFGAPPIHRKLRVVSGLRSGIDGAREIMFFQSSPRPDPVPKMRRRVGIRCLRSPGSHLIYMSALTAANHVSWKRRRSPGPMAAAGRLIFPASTPYPRVHGPVLLQGGDLARCFRVPWQCSTEIDMTRIPCALYDPSSGR